VSTLYCIRRASDARCARSELSTNSNATRWRRNTQDPENQTDSSSTCAPPPSLIIAPRLRGDRRDATRGWLAPLIALVPPSRCSSLSLGKRGGRHGRNAGYPAPPVQTRTCSFPASGSSVALASAQGRTVISSRPCLLWPAGRLAHAAPVRHVRDEFPVQAACFRRGLPRVVGFPHL